MNQSEAKTIFVREFFQNIAKIPKTVVSDWWIVYTIISAQFIFGRPLDYEKNVDDLNKRMHHMVTVGNF